MQESFNTIPSDKTVVVYCYTGQTAGQTVAALRMLGYDAVSLNGGMGMEANAPYGWSNKGFDVYEGTGLAGIVDSYFAAKPDSNYKISQVAFIEKVKAEEDMFVLDIRQPDVYAEGHIKGAVNAPWGTAISDNLDMIPADKPVYVYCYTGQTAGQTVALLNFAGVEAYSVNLGWNLGISKVEGYEDVVATEASDFGPAVAADYTYEIESAIEMYYSGLAGVSDGIYKNYKISEDNLKAILDEKADSIYVLSVRSAKDFAEGHIPTALNIPWAAGMQEAFPTLNNDKTTVVYCYTGQTAGQTTAALRILGYDAVSLNGGMGMEANAPSGWSNKGYETVK
jgi:rhodanese-related sulfurtransferase